MIFLLRRLLLTLPVVFGVATLSFLLLHFVPGDPVDIILGDQAASVDKAALRGNLGLDQPLARQYAHFISRLLHADLGRSLINKRPIVSEIVERVPATAELTFTAMLLAMGFGIPLGLLSAAFKNSVLDKFCLFLSFVAAALPSFWLAPILIWIFALKLDLLPVSERGGLSHLILPAATLATGLSAVLMQMTRSAVLEVIRADYIRVARAKGAREFAIYTKHAAKNAAMPLITVIGLQFGGLLTGAVIVETVFDWPGIGTLLFQSIQQRNYPLVQGTVLFMALTFVLITTLTDILYTIANPQIRYL